MLKSPTTLIPILLLEFHCVSYGIFEGLNGNEWGWTWAVLFPLLVFNYEATLSKLKKEFKKLQDNAS